MRRIFIMFVAATLSYGNVLWAGPPQVAVSIGQNVSDLHHIKFEATAEKTFLQLNLIWPDQLWGYVAQQNILIGTITRKRDLSRRIGYIGISEDLIYGPPSHYVTAGFGVLLKNAAPPIFFQEKIALGTQFKPLNLELFFLHMSNGGFFDPNREFNACGITFKVLG